MPICPYYTSKTTRTVSKVQTGNRNPRKPIIREINKCTHPESLHKVGTITKNVPCGGAIASCIIPSKLK